MFIHLNFFRTEIMDLIRPTKETLLSEIITRNQEAIYASTKKRPLGCSFIQDLPPYLDKYKTTFGMIYEKGKVNVIIK